MNFLSKKSKKNLDPAVSIKLLQYLIEFHLEFLTLKDICNLFLTNRSIYKMQTSFPFLVSIGRRCVDPNLPENSSLRKYFKKMLLKSKGDASTRTVLQTKILRELETKLVLSRNAIFNSSGKYDFDGWKITANGGNKWKIEDFFTHGQKKTCFVTSYATCTMNYIVPIEKFLTQQVTVEDLMQRAKFKAGCYIARRWDCRAHGEASFTVYDKEENQIFHERVFMSSEQLPGGTGSFAPYMKIEICFKPDKDKAKSIKYLKLELSGQDDQFWAGHYGARFSGAYIRCYYQDVEEIPGLDISIKDDRRLALKEKYPEKKDVKKDEKKNGKKESQPKAQKKPGFFGKWL